MLAGMAGFKNPIRDPLFQYHASCGVQDASFRRVYAAVNNVVNLLGNKCNISDFDPVLFKSKVWI